MTKIKILRFALGLFIGANVISAFIISYIAFFTDLYYNLPRRYEDSLRIIQNSFYLNQAALLPALVYIYCAVNGFIGMGYFNDTSAKYLKRGGMFLIASAVIKSCLSVYKVANSNDKNKYVFLEPAVSGILVILIIGFALFIIADFLRKGEAIERENNLTI